MAVTLAKKADTEIAHLPFMGGLFFLVGPEKMLLGADVKGLTKARFTPNPTLD